MYRTNKIKEIMKNLIILSVALMLSTIATAQTKTLNINTLEKQNHLYGEGERFDAIKYDNLTITKGDTIYINQTKDKFSFVKDKNQVGYIVVKEIYLNKHDITSMDKVKYVSWVQITGDNKKSKIHDIKKAFQSGEIYIKRG